MLHCTNARCQWFVLLLAPDDDDHDVKMANRTPTPSKIARCQGQVTNKRVRINRPAHQLTKSTNKHRLGLNTGRDRYQSNQIKSKAKKESRTDEQTKEQFMAANRVLGV